MKDKWPPSSRYEMLLLAQRWCRLLQENAPLWEIPPGDVDEMQGLTDEFTEAARYAGSANHSSRDIARCNEAQAAAMKKMRYIKNRYFHIPPLTAMDLLFLGLREKKKARPIKEPATIPEFAIRYPGGKEEKIEGMSTLLIRFKDAGKRRKGKPYGAAAAVIRYACGPEQLSNPDLLTREMTATRSPYHMVLPVEQGKAVWISMALCWQTRTGKRGRFTQVQSTVLC